MLIRRLWVDPAFITTSTIGAGLQVHPNNYYENSEINSRGVPYGFYSVEFGRRETGFPILIDVNAEETAFNKVITYLEEGFYLDKYTKSLKVEILTYNADLRYFCRYVSNFCSLKQEYTRRIDSRRNGLSTVLLRKKR